MNGKLARRRKLLRWGKFLPVLYLFQLGCLPDNAFAQVTAENMLLTTAIVVQTTTAQFVNGIFGLLFPTI